MKQNIYTIYDSKAKTFERPLMALNHGLILRTFIDVANDKQHPIGQHPEDYTLYHIEVYDDETGTYENVKHENLGTADQHQTTGAKNEISNAE